MATYTQLTRNADGTYKQKIMKSSETFYLVEYSTIATYYKVDAPSFEEAVDQIDDAQHEGVTSIDRTDVFIDYATGKEDAYIRMKELEDLRELNSNINLPNSHNNYGVR
tara:strand:+ start:4293 stop:4619 length:327 start_codon:yes stop_codon:yes gene_type:complete